MRKSYTLGEYTNDYCWKSKLGQLAKKYHQVKKMVPRREVRIYRHIFNIFSCGQQLSIPSLAGRADLYLNVQNKERNDAGHEDKEKLNIWYRLTFDLRRSLGEDGNGHNKKSQFFVGLIFSVHGLTRGNQT